MAELANADLNVKFDPEKTYTRKYERVHPQTRDFIDKFGLNDRLFEPRKREDHFQPYFEQTQQEQQGVAGSKRTAEEASMTTETNYYYDEYNESGS